MNRLKFATEKDFSKFFNPLENEKVTFSKEDLKKLYIQHQKKIRFERIPTEEEFPTYGEIKFPSTSTDDGICAIFIYFPEMVERIKKEEDTEDTVYPNVKNNWCFTSLIFKKDNTGMFACELPFFSIIHKDKIITL